MNQIAEEAYQAWQRNREDIGPMSDVANLYRQLPQAALDAYRSALIAMQPFEPIQRGAKMLELRGQLKILEEVIAEKKAEAENALAPEQK